MVASVVIASAMGVCFSVGGNCSALRESARIGGAMAHHPLDDQIDQLYQLPLDEFTAARNALAKEAGPKAAEIKQLEKPNSAAWAINQLFWSQRKLYDQVIDAAASRREAYRKILAGQNAEAEKIDADHRAAIRQAGRAAREILEKAGNKPTDVVMRAIAETLDALPSAAVPGRLTKSLKRIGFEGLEGVPVSAGPKKVTPIASRVAKAEPSKQPSAKEREAAQAKARELAMARERLRFAEAAEREAHEALERAQRNVERTERTRDRVEQELEEATDAARKARKEETAAQTAYDKAAAERKQLMKRLS